MLKIALGLSLLVSSTAFASDCNVAAFDLMMKTSKEHYLELEKNLAEKGYEITNKKRGLVITAGVIEKPVKPQKPQKPQVKEEDSSEEGKPEGKPEAGGKTVRFTIVTIEAGKKTLFGNIQKLSPKDDGVAIVEKALAKLPACKELEEN